MSPQARTENSTPVLLSPISGFDDLHYSGFRAGVEPAMVGLTPADAGHEVRSCVCPLGVDHAADRLAGAFADLAEFGICLVTLFFWPERVPLGGLSHPASIACHLAVPG